MEARGTHDGSEGRWNVSICFFFAMLRCGMLLHKSLLPQSVLLSLSSDLVYMTSEQEREQLFFPTRVFPMPAYSFLLPAPLAKALPRAQPPGPSLEGPGLHTDWLGVGCVPGRWPGTWSRSCEELGRQVPSSLMRAPPGTGRANVS